MDAYEESSGFNYVWVLGSVGAVLIGLGFLLVVANNWNALPDLGKLGLLIGSLVGALTTSQLIRDKTHYTSLALLYTSALIFGSGLFLIVDAYSVSMEPSTQIYIWVLGVLALSAYRKDLILFLFAHFLTFFFMVIGFDQWLFFHAVPLIALLFTGSYFVFSKPVVPYFSLLIGLEFIFYTLNYANLDTFYIVWILFAIGMGLFYIKHDWRPKAFKVIGMLTVGVTGFALSFSELWQSIEFFGDGQVISIGFSIAFAVYLLYLLTKKQIIPLIIVGALILRYYFDTLYDFLPRALFFVLGGVIILAIGVVIERLSKE